MYIYVYILYIYIYNRYNSKFRNCSIPVLQGPKDLRLLRLLEYRR